MYFTFEKDLNFVEGWTQHCELNGVPSKYDKNEMLTRLNLPGVFPNCTTGKDLSARKRI